MLSQVPSSPGISIFGIEGKHLRLALCFSPARIGQGTASLGRSGVLKPASRWKGQKLFREQRPTAYLADEMPSRKSITSGPTVSWVQILHSAVSNYLNSGHCLHANQPPHLQHRVRMPTCQVGVNVTATQ